MLILQNMLIYAFFIDCRESHLCTFCCQIYQCARIGGGWVKPILAMPGFRKRLLVQPLPKWCCLRIFEAFPEGRGTQSHYLGGKSSGASREKRRRVRCTLSTLLAQAGKRVLLPTASLGRYLQSATLDSRPLPIFAGEIFGEIFAICNFR